MKTINNVKIIDTNIFGNGIAKVDNKVIFVNNACTNDIVDIAIDEEKKNYSFGSITNATSLSNLRNNEYCSSCGGCPLAHINYDYQLKIKTNYIISCFKKQGINIAISDTVYDKQFRYRNKAVFHFKDSKFGYYEDSSNTLAFPNECDCVLLPDNYKNIINFFNDNISEINVNPSYLYLRNNYKNEIILTLGSTQDINDSIKAFAKKALKSFPFISSFYYGQGKSPEDSDYIKVLGDEYICDIFNGLKVSISPKSFYQVNKVMAEKLVKHVSNLIMQTSNTTIVDLFCGIGLFGLSIAKDIPSANVIGVEINASSINNANENANANNLKNIRFCLGDSSIFGNELKDANIDTVVLDPPRFGCNAKTIEELLKYKPKNIIYVSCNPVSLANNCKDLLSEYSISDVSAFDLFPNTSHVESVVLLTRN